MQKLALLTAAGKGERFGGLMAKELYPLGSEKTGGKLFPKPISRYMFDALKLVNPDLFYFVIHPSKPQIMDYYGNGRNLGINISYLIQEKPTSQYEAIEEIRYFMKKDDIVFYGMPDTAIGPPTAFIELYASHLKNKSDITIGLFKVNNPHFFTTIELDKKNDFLKAEVKPKNPKTNWIWGIFIFNYTLFLVADKIRGKKKGVVGSDDIGTIFNEAHNNGVKIVCHKFEKGKYYDFANYERVLDYIRGKHSL